MQKVQEKPQAPLTVEQAKVLRHGQTLYHRINRNRDGSAQRWRVASVVKTWKRNSSRIQFTVKYGLRTWGIVREYDLELLSLEDCV